MAYHGPSWPKNNVAVPLITHKFSSSIFIIGIVCVAFTEGKINQPFPFSFIPQRPLGKGRHRPGAGQPRVLPGPVQIEGLRKATARHRSKSVQGAERGQGSEKDCTGEFWVFFLNEKAYFAAGISWQDKGIFEK